MNALSIALGVIALAANVGVAALVRLGGYLDDPRGSTRIGLGDLGKAERPPVAADGCC